jgi:hypothetical protein
LVNQSLTDKSISHIRGMSPCRVDYFLSNCYSLATSAEGKIGYEKPVLIQKMPASAGIRSLKYGTR